MSQAETTPMPSKDQKYNFRFTDNILNMVNGLKIWGAK